MSKRFEYQNIDQDEPSIIGDDLEEVKAEVRKRGADFGGLPDAFFVTFGTRTLVYRNIDEARRFGAEPKDPTKTTPPGYVGVIYERG